MLWPVCRLKYGKQVVGREVVIDLFEYNSFEQFGMDKKGYRSEVLEFIRVEDGLL